MADPKSSVNIAGYEFPAVFLVDATTGLPYVASGGGGGGGGAVTVADGADVTLGAKADAKSTATDTTPVTAMQVLKQISASVQAPPAQAVTQSGTWTVQPGNTANTTAWKVDGSAVTQPVSSTTLATAANQTSTNTKLDTLHTDLIAPTPQLPTALGSQAAAGALGTAASTEDVARVGIVTETAPASDTASSGLNGRLQRIAQNITTWVAKLTATANADANRLPVSLDIASPVTGTSVAATDLTNMPFVVGKGAQSVIVHITANTATANFFFSVDGVAAYVAVAGWLSTDSGAGSPRTTATTTGVFIFPVQGTHFKVTQTGAGGITATVTPSATWGPKIVQINSQVQLTANVQGTVAHGASISGSPVRIGARGRNFGLPYTAITADQTADVVTNLIGHLKTTKEYSFSNLKANATTTIKSGAGVLHTISINTKGITNTVTVYDNTAGSGTTIATLDTTLGQDTLIYDAVFATGLTAVIAGGTAADVTFTYN